MIVMAMGGIAFALQIVDVWPILASRPATLVPSLLTHLGVVLILVSILVKVRRNQPVLFMDAAMLTFLILASWGSYLRLIEKFAVR